MEDSFNNTNNNCDSKYSDSYFENNDNNDENSFSVPNRLSSLSNMSSNSISSFNLYIKSNTQKVNIKIDNIKKFFFCEKCKQFYVIDFTSYYFIAFGCDCYDITSNCTIDQFIQEYTTEDEEEVDNNSYCKYHNKKYKIYCRDCQGNFCEDCEKETKQYNNIPIIIGKHETHGVIYLQDEIKRIIRDLDSKLKKIKAKYSHELKFKDGPIKILNLIIDLKRHENYYCYNLYRSLNNALQFCSNFEIPVVQKMIKIQTIKELKENIYNNNPIISITIINQKIVDLSLFRKLDSKNLEELNLNNNEIEDISPLENCNFDNLEKFDIEENKLNNNNIKILKKLKMPNVKWINLFDNKFTKTEIFEIPQKCPNLEVYFVGNNKFDKEELSKDKIYVFPEKLHKFGLTGNLTQETIDFILKLKIEKLKTLFISRNELNSLSFLQNIKFENLEEIWPSFNNIKDWKEIKYINS